MTGWSAYPPILSVNADILAQPGSAITGCEQVQQIERLIRTLSSARDGSLSDRENTVVCLERTHETTRGRLHIEP